MDVMRSLAIAAALASASPTLEETMLKKLTPVLIVDAIEPSLPFWVERLGFEVTVKVPEDESQLAFVILVRDRVEVMLQTRSSVLKEDPALAQGSFRSALFIEVEQLAPIQKSLAGYHDLVIEERTTFYGATECTARDPDGNLVTFAEFVKAGDDGDR